MDNTWKKAKSYTQKKIFPNEERELFGVLCKEVLTLKYKVHNRLPLNKFFLTESKIIRAQC